MTNATIEKVCIECRVVVFELGPAQVDWYALRGLKLPLRCPACRRRRRAASAAVTEDDAATQ